MTPKPRLLDLFCGAGGAAMGYSRAGFEVVGVDIKPQPHYPFPFLQMDAIGALIKLTDGNGLTFNDGKTLYLHSSLKGRDFAVIHASPPCEHYTVMQHIRKNENAHPDLIDTTRVLLIKTGKQYIIENVYKSPLRAQLMLCGTMFGLRIIRHRYFECPSLPMLLQPPCNHSDVYDPWHGKRNSDEFRKAMGIDWMPDAGGEHRVGTVAQAIPPAYTEYIGKYLMAEVLRRKDGTTN